MPAVKWRQFIHYISHTCHGHGCSIGRASFLRSLKKMQLFDVGSNTGRSIRWQEKSPSCVIMETWKTAVCEKVLKDIAHKYQ